MEQIITQIPLIQQNVQFSYLTVVVVKDDTERSLLLETIRVNSRIKTSCSKINEMIKDCIFKTNINLSPTSNCQMMFMTDFEQYLEVVKNNDDLLKRFFMICRENKPLLSIYTEDINAFVNKWESNYIKYGSIFLKNPLNNVGGGLVWINVADYNY
jgi:hypothetical protein